jgi:hypothetical protein
VQPDPWRQRAQCAGSDPEAWSTENLPEDQAERARYARRVCDGCEVIRECAKSALDYPYRHGEFLTGVIVAGFAAPGNPSKVRACENFRKRIADRFDLPYSNAAPSVLRAAANNYEQE